MKKEVPVVRGGRGCETCPHFRPAEERTTDDRQRPVWTDLPLPVAGHCAELDIPVTESMRTRTRHQSCPGLSSPGVTTKRAIFAQREDLADLMSRGQAVRPGSCSGCRMFISPDQMFTDLGVPSGACAAYGVLIPQNEAIATESNCIIGSVREVNEEMDNVPGGLLEPFSSGATPLIPIEPGMAKPADPSDSVGDIEASDDDRAAGIRAWRPLADPLGHGEDVLVPIFDPDHFDEVERSKIPATGSDEHPELYRDHQGLLYRSMVLWRYLGETPALNGVPGVGKTELFRYAAWVMQLPFERISVTRSTELDDLQGKMVFESGETAFRYGRIPKAWSKPCVIVIDEPNAGPPDVWQFLRPLTDDSKQLVLDASRGERIERHEHCYMGMAFNPAWDPRNSGVDDLSDADGSRLMHIAVQMPSEKVEREIIRERCALDGHTISDETMKSIMGIAADLRSLAAEGAFPIHWGVRQQIKVARASRWFSMAESYRMAAGDLLSPDDASQMKVVVSAHCG